MNGPEAFEALELRIGRVLRAEFNLKASKPAFKLWIDFGDLGTKTSSAQLTERYTPQDLTGRMVAAVMNLGTRQVAGFPSEVLVLGALDTAGRVGLLSTEPDVPPGSRVY